MSSRDSRATSAGWGAARPGWLVAVAGLGALAACEAEVEPRLPSPPAQSIHRLNRLEYNNTVRDLLGTQLRPADAFPPDGEQVGFDNIAEALQLTPTLLDAYFSAARQVVDDALDPHPAFALVRRHNQLGVAGGHEVGDLWALNGNAVQIDFEVEAGDVTFTLLAGAAQIGPAPAAQIRVELDGAPLQTLAVQGTAAAIAAHVYPLTLAAGPHTIRVVPTNFINDAAGNTGNNVLVRSVAVESVAKIEGPGRERIFVCDPAGEAREDCYAEIIETFASRAWRRPLRAAELDGQLTLWNELVAAGESDEAALRLVMRALLTSPGFLYRARTSDDDDARGWLDGYVLASRLSYFLWSSMPDDRLFEAAADGTLASPEGLADAVGWMLADPRAAGLLDGFVEQWLSTRGLALASPSAEAYPEFDEALRQAMVAETKAFFADFLTSGAPVTAMLAPGFAYVNDRLAAHYGMPLPGSDAMVKVTPAAGRGGGLLSLSAWLTARSEAHHSSPIRRGAFVSANLLCRPVPAPPAGLEIPALEVSEGLSVRQQMENHRDNPTCSSCHALLDVLGMGFERFDGIGRVIADPALDTLGELPDGRTFEGSEGLAALMAPEELTSCLTAKLMTYALGRAPQVDDNRTIADIAARTAEEQLSLADLLVEIVNAPAFRAPGKMEDAR